MFAQDSVCVCVLVCLCVVLALHRDPAVLTKLQQPCLLASARHTLTPSRQIAPLNQTTHWKSQILSLGMKGLCDEAGF